MAALRNLRAPEWRSQQTLARIPDLDRRAIRAHAEARLSVDCMVDDYVKVYQRLPGRPKSEACFVHL